MAIIFRSISWCTVDDFGGVRGVQTGLLTSLAKYESRMSGLELAHQCLVVWNTWIAFRKVDMSRYMEDPPSCEKMIPHSDSVPQPQSPASVVFQEGHELPNLVLHPLGKLPVRCPLVCRDPPPVGAGFRALAAASALEPCGVPAVPLGAPPAMSVEFAGGWIRGPRASRII